MQAHNFEHTLQWAFWYLLFLQDCKWDLGNFEKEICSWRCWYTKIYCWKFSKIPNGRGQECVTTNSWVTQARQWLEEWGYRRGSLIEKLPESWKDDKNNMKHKKKTSESWRFDHAHSNLKKRTACKTKLTKPKKFHPKQMLSKVSLSSLYTSPSFLITIVEISFNPGTRTNWGQPKLTPNSRNIETAMYVENMGIMHMKACIGRGMITLLEQMWLKLKNIVDAIVPRSTWW